LGRDGACVLITLAFMTMQRRLQRGFGGASKNCRNGRWNVQDHNG
jgi:hypothetical protein